MGRVFVFLNYLITALRIINIFCGAKFDLRKRSATLDRVSINSRIKCTQTISIQAKLYYIAKWFKHFTTIFP